MTQDEAWIDEIRKDLINSLSKAQLKNVDTEGEAVIEREADRLEALITAKLKEVEREAYRHGYNDNARDCNCDKFSIKPHHHLLDDGKSHSIKPDIPKLNKIGEQE